MDARVRVGRPILRTLDVVEVGRVLDRLPGRGLCVGRLAFVLETVPGLRKIRKLPVPRRRRLGCRVLTLDAFDTTTRT